MRARSVISALLAILVAALAAMSVAPAQTASPQRAVLYTLGKGSNYQQGCFGPCLCPIMMIEEMRGRLLLAPTGFDGLYRHYAVADVKWVVGSGASARVLTGSGTYKVGGEFAVMQQLTLDLSTDGGPVERFDSGLVPGGGGFPAIDTAISIHGFYCFDTGMEIRAWPAMRIDVERDRLDWEPARDATCYDLVMGDLRSLRETGGDFAVSTDRCLADDAASTWIPFTDTPAPGEGFWFLVRSTDGLTDDTYDSVDPWQVGSRDAWIAASPASCP